ncbi:MAG TPA: FAD-dependent oxidoreductase [Pseudonocardiaceae bacterium]|mgnify:CR=1 FL=1
MAEQPTPGPSYWERSAPGPDRTATPLPAEADVVVAGAGIAGLTTAYLLTLAGRSVVVLEADRVAAGVSGATTAKISAQHGMKYRKLVSRHGRDAAARYAAGQLAALAWIEAEAQRLGVDCEFSRRDSWLFVEDPTQLRALQEEAEAQVEAGLPAEFTDADLPFPTAGAVRLRDQAQFHPRRWLLALAEHAAAAGCVIAENARVLDVEGSGPRVVRSTRGDVRAEHVVVTTHYPILDRGGFFARLDPVRDLVVAGVVPEGTAPQGMYLGVDRHHSIRTAPYPDGRQLVIVLGEHYRTGQAVDVLQRYRRLADWAQERLGVPEPAYWWSSQDLGTPDGLPYVGRYHPRAHGLWVATGFGQWGMTNSTLAGMVLRNLIVGDEDEWAGLFAPGRIPGARAALSLLRSNASVASHLVSGHVHALGETRRPADLEPGQAEVCRVGNWLVAAYRDPEGTLHAVSARCTHLGCVVTFNNAEKSWDCPCHASRYGLDGRVLHGPAVRPLQRIDPTSLDE